MKNSLYRIIILGAIWGAFEATVGYLLHFFGIRIGSMIWFPIAYFFVHRAYRYTGSLSAAMLTAFIASSLKLINLFFPGRVDLVINPAVSIILEALSIVLVYKYTAIGKIDSLESNKINPLAVMLTGFIWRSLYICYIFLMPQSYREFASFTETASFLEFMFVKNIINIIIITAGFFAAELFKKYFSRDSENENYLPGGRKQNPIYNKPVFAAGSMILAIIANIYIR